MRFGVGDVSEVDCSASKPLPAKTDANVASNCRFCNNSSCAVLSADAPPPHLHRLDRGDQIAASGHGELRTAIEGLFALCAALPDGRRQIISLYAPQEMIQVPVRTKELDFWIEALTPSTLCARAFGNGNGSARRLNGEKEAVLQAQQQQLARQSEHIVTLGRLGGTERMCWFLTDMARRIGCDTAAGKRVHLPLSREDIADYLGLNAETVSRILGRIKKLGKVTFLSPTDYVIADIDALENCAPESPGCRPNAPIVEATA